MPDQNQQDLRLLTTVPSSAEAVMVVGDLEAAGIRAIPEASTRGDTVFGAPIPLDIYVRADDLDRAREVLSEPLSEDELLRAEEDGEGD